MFKNRLLTVCIFLGVCVVTIVTTVIGALIFDLLSGSNKAEAEVVPASFPRLAQNLQGELNTAMSPEFPFNFDMTGNPFKDASGVSFEAKNTENSPLGKKDNPLTLPPKIVNKTPSNSTPLSVQMFGNQNQPNNGLAPLPTPIPTPGPDANALLADRNRKIRQGEEVGDLPMIYSVEDVKPIGIIGSGNKNRIWLYSPTTKQTFSVAKGTRFRDGAVEGVNSDGVVFKREDGKEISVRWSKEGYKGDDPNSPFLRVPSKKPEQAKNTGNNDQPNNEERPN